MSSEPRGRHRSESGRVQRVGAGFAVTARHLYVWEESLDEARGWGVELGVLPDPPQRPRPRHDSGGSRFRAAS